MPPLVSDNLNFEYDHLRTAYAKILEEAIAKRPGASMQAPAN